MQPYSGDKAADQYLLQRVQAASPEQLVAMLLEGAQRFLNNVIQAIENRDVPTKTRYVNRVTDIIFELNERLNHEQGGELVNNLIRIYEWWTHEVFTASVQNRVERLRVVQAQMGEIRSSWEELHLKKVREQAAARPASGSLEGLIV